MSWENKKAIYWPEAIALPKKSKLLNPPGNFTGNLDKTEDQPLKITLKLQVGTEDRI